MISQEQISNDKKCLEEMYKKYDLRVHELMMSDTLSPKDKVVLWSVAEVLEALEEALSRMRHLPSYESL